MRRYLGLDQSAGFLIILQDLHDETIAQSGSCTRLAGIKKKFDLKERTCMKKIPFGKTILSGLIITLASISSLKAFFGRTIAYPRSQSINAAREIVGWQELINRGDTDCNYWSVSLTPEYTRTLKGKELTNYLLGGCRCFTFSGSLAYEHEKTDILADYFGVPLDYISCMSFDPVLGQFIMDFNFYYGFQSLHPGLYLQLDMPIVHANWDLNAIEVPITKGTIATPAGYMAATKLLPQNLPQTVEDVLDGLTTFGDLQEPLKSGLIFNREIKTHFSDVQIVIGDNFFLSDWYHAGLNARVYLPTGSKPSTEFFLEPIIGDLRHWQAGVGFTGHVDFDYGCYSGGIYCDANITHLFAALACRSFDFKNNPGSRYMLLEQITPSSQQLFISPGGPAAPNQYSQKLVYAINKTSLTIKTSIKIQTDIAIKVCARRDGWGADVGYNFWYRSPEKLLCRQAFPENMYALKGDSQLYGFTSTDNPIALNATQHAATLRGGQGAGNFVEGSQLQNLNVDSPAQAEGPTNAQALFNITSADAASFGFTRTTVQASNPAILLKDSDIDVCSGLVPRGLTNKLFGHVGYTWTSESCIWVPFFGIGGEVEWASHCKPNNAFTQWGIWLKMGFSC